MPRIEEGDISDSGNRRSFSAQIDEGTSRLPRIPPAAPPSDALGRFPLNSLAFMAFNL
jgi:hypothetical protein